MQLMDLNRPNEWALISLLIDVKFSDAQADALMKDLSFFELVGVSQPSPNVPDGNRPCISYHTVS